MRFSRCNKHLPFFLVALLVMNEALWAQAPGQTQVTRSIQILPVPPFDMVSNLAFGGQSVSVPDSASSFVKVKLIVGCYGRNLRSVRNPISPDSEIKLGLGLGPAPGLPVEIAFPGWLVKSGTGYGQDAVALQGSFDASAEYDISPAFGQTHVPIMVEGPPNNVAAAAAYGNVIDIQTTIPISTLVAFNATGGYSPSARNNTIAYLNFIQNLVHTSDPANNCMNESPKEKQTLRQSVVSWINQNLFPAAQAGGDGTFPPGGDGGGDGSSANYKNWDTTYVTSPVVDWIPNNPGPGSPWQAKCENRVKIPRAGKKNTKDVNKYIGLDGPMNFQYISSWASNFSVLELYVSFPGEDQFCGGYFSPLMLFPDSKRPRFNGRSSMMNRPDPGFSAWVEPNAPGTFLALDRNHNGRIDDSTELFGEDELAANGFAKLAQYDENHDNILDAKDPIFKRLLFFTDRNGNGQSDPGEIASASAAGLISIDLKYEVSAVREYNRGLASSREHSSYLFRDPKTKKISRGEVIDVWFGRK